MALDKGFVLLALAYALVGISMGIYMAASHNHSLYVVHAHILLVGFLLSFVYGVLHRLWVEQPHKAVALSQFVAHHAGAITMSIALFMLYSGMASLAQLESVLAAASLAILASLLLMSWMVIANGRRQPITEMA